MALGQRRRHVDKYDVVLFSCEGTETAHINAPGQQVILDYANNGGRVFASHFHYAIFNTGPFATMAPAPVATWTTGANIDNDPINGIINQTISAGPNMGKAFPEGQALQTWLGNVGALTGRQAPHPLRARQRRGGHGEHPRRSG